MLSWSTALCACTALSRDPRDVGVLANVCGTLLESESTPPDDDGWRIASGVLVETRAEAMAVATMAGSVEACLILTI